MKERQISEKKANNDEKKVFELVFLFLKRKIYLSTYSDRKLNFKIANRRMTKTKIKHQANAQMFTVGSNQDSLTDGTVNEWRIDRKNDRLAFHLYQSFPGVRTIHTCMHAPHRHHSSTYYIRVNTLRLSFSLFVSSFSVRNVAWMLYMCLFFVLHLI